MQEYLVDKVKLYYYGIELHDVQKMMNMLSVDISVKNCYESNKIANCRYNYLIESKKGNIYVGIEPNWLIKPSKKRKDVVVEYNPNKVNVDDFNSLRILTLLSYSNIEVMSMDIARDIFTHKINELLIHKRHGNEYYCKMGHSNAETIYLGAFGTSGAIRIYNKAKEQKLKKDVIWTRFEIRYKKLGFLDVRSDEVIKNISLPKIYGSNDVNVAFQELKGVDKFLYITSLSDIDMLELLDRRMKKKILEYHDLINYEILIDMDKIIEVYRNFQII